MGGMYNAPPSSIIASTSTSQIPSGILFNAWEAHYRQVNVLRFTPDGAALVSGSDDSSVSVWSVTRYDSGDRDNEPLFHIPS